MNIITMAWELGIISVLLIFGAKIGLAIGFAGLRRRYAAGIIIGYGVGLYLLIWILGKAIGNIYPTLNKYIVYITLLMAAILIAAGIHTLHEWKQKKKNTAQMTCLAMVAPCPCCFGAVLAAIILAAPMVGVSSLLLGKYSAILLSVFIAVFYLFSKVIVDALNKPYPIILGNFMLFVGLYFLIATILIPNISALASSKFSPVNVPAPHILLSTALALFALLIVGGYYYKKKSVFVR